MNVRSIVVVANKNTKSILYIVLKGIGLIIEEVPNTRNVLNILDPIMFPTTKSSFFLNKATKETTSSGRDVPIAKSVAEIRNSDRPRLVAIVVAESTTSFPPTNNATIPPSINIAVFLFDSFSFSSSGNILALSFLLII